MPCNNCNKPGHWSRNCLYPKKNANQGGRQGHVHYNSIEEIPSGEVVTAGKFLVDQYSVVVLFDSGALHSFIILCLHQSLHTNYILLKMGVIALELQVVIFPQIK
jgi:hypothetical protein